MARLFSVKSARAGGWDDQRIQQFLQQNPDIQPDEPLAPQGNSGWTDFLPAAGGIVGGIAGAPLGGVGAVGGSALGSAGGEALRQMIQGEQLSGGNIAKEGALGLAGGVAGEALGAGLRVGGKLLSKTLTGAGDNIAISGLGATGPMLTKFKNTTGVGLPDAIRAQGMVGKGFDEIAERARVVQEIYDKAARAAGSKVSAARYADDYTMMAKEYVDSDIPERVAIGEDLLKRADSIRQKYGNKKIDVAKILEDRKGIDAIRSGRNWTEPANAPLDIQRDIMKKTIDDATGGVTAAAGKDLQQLYQMQSIAQKGESRAAATNPFGLRAQLGVGGGLGYGALTGTDENRVQNALTYGVGGFALQKLLSNPRVLQAMSGAATKAGDATARGVGAGTVGRIAGQPIARGLLAGEQQGLPSADTAVSQTSSQMAGAAQLADPADRFLEMVPLIMIQDIERTGGKNVPELMQVANVIKLQKDMSKGGFKPTEKQKLFSASAQGAQHALDLLESGKVQTGPIKGRIQSLKAATVGADANQQDFAGTIAIARSSLLNAYLGGAIPAQEYERIAAGIPTENDPIPTAKQKLKTFIREVNRAAQGQIQAPISVQQSAF